MYSKHIYQWRRWISWGPLILQGAFRFHSNILFWGHNVGMWLLFLCHEDKPTFQGWLLLPALERYHPSVEDMWN